MAYWLGIDRHWYFLDSAVVGVICGILISVRPYMGVYVLIGVAVAVYRMQKNRPKGNSKYVTHVALICLPIAIAIAQVLIVNRWMTGSFFHSPYDFGEGDFKSFDFAYPHLSTILFHPWHGMLIYHPLYVIAFFALVLRVLNKKLPAPERLLMLSLVIAIVTHYYIQASWYCWWLGLGTFGMRGMGITAVILVPVLIRFISELSSRSFINYFLLTLIAASCLWSFALMWQGNTQFMTYHDLFTAQLTMLRKKRFFNTRYFSHRIWLYCYGIWYYLKNGNRANGLEVLSMVGIGFIYSYYIRGFTLFFNNKLSPNITIIITTFSAMVLLFLVTRICAVVQWTKSPQRKAEVLIGSSICASFIISTILFGRLMIHTEVGIAQTHKINLVSSHRRVGHFIIQKLRLRMRST